MNNWQNKPLSFSEVLDVTFHIFKVNFAKIFQIMLIFLGPIYLLQALGQIAGGASLLIDHRTGNLATIIHSFSQNGAPVPSAGSEISLGIFYIISFLLLVLISTPMAYASLIILTEQAGKPETSSISAIIKRAFSRFWALLGGNIVFALVIFGLYIGIVLVIVGYLFVVGALGAIQGGGSSDISGLGIHIVVVVILSITALCGLVYLMTRWSFYFAAIVFDKVSPGLGKSWRLTRGCFWRLLGLYIIVAIINGIILGVIETTAAAILGTSVLAFLLNSIVSLLISALPVIAYAVAFLDLRVRNEAADLKSMLENYPVQQPNDIEKR